MSATDPARVAVVIPALNEELAIRGVVESVLAIAPNVIVIDDGSTDATVERIADLPVTLIRHDQPLGKGQGLRDGFRKALELGFDAVIAMDGDGQHLASDIPRMLAAARAYPEHIVIGARIRNKENQPPARRRANAVADWGISWGCGVPISDTQSGQRYYPRAAIDIALALPHDGFVFESEILIECAARGIHTVSVPIRASYEEERRASHFKPFRDVTRITRMIAGRLLRGGLMLGNLRRSRTLPPIVVDLPAS